MFRNSKSKIILAGLFMSLFFTSCSTPVFSSKNSTNSFNSTDSSGSSLVTDSYDNNSTSYNSYSSNSSSDNSTFNSNSSTSSSSKDIEPTYEKLNIENQVTTHVGQTMKVVANVERHIPETMQNGGLSRYPYFGTKLENITDDEKRAILNEDAELRASSTTYDSMDEEGNLYLNNVPTGTKLYKHTSSQNMYYGDISDSEPAVKKEITISPRPLGNHLTGLYAPAGEVIKVEINDDDLKATGGLIISIGQVSQRNRNNNIWFERNDFVRMPNICNQMEVNKTVAYVGYSLGGPIYVTPKNPVPFKVTISGAVEYPHFIYGYTTREEFEAMKKLSAPIFDFEIWDNAVRHSGPKKFVNMDYDNLMKVGKLWLDIVKISKQVPTGSNNSIGITFLYEPFVAAGGAVAFVGQNFCNLPSDWIYSALDYQSFTSNGAWGTIHEYNHHFQRYGLYPGDEVTNNALNILSYISYTNISSKRSEDDKTLTDWNRYVDPSRSLRETIENSNKDVAQSSLNAYVDIIHTFGVDKFIKATQRYAYQGGIDTWYQALVETTGYDMTYYFENMLHLSVSEEIKNKVSLENLPMFIPAACLYQTGRNYYDGENEVFVKTVKPFNIEYGKEFTFDLNKHLFVPNDFTYEILDISNPLHGKIEEISNKVYKYIPDSKYENSGEIKLKIRLNSNLDINTPEITFTLEFTQAYSGLQAVKYAFDEQKYKTVKEAIANNFEGYSNKIEYKNHRSTFMNGVSPNMFGVIEGKFAIPEDGNYVFCFRSDRGNHALYLGINTPNLEEKLDLNNGNNAFRSDGDHTFQLTLKKDDLIYFKEVITTTWSYDAYMEIGYAKIDENGNVNNVNTLPSSMLFNSNEEYKKYDFKYEEIYQREYEVDALKADLKKQSIVSVNYDSWDNNYLIDNILDGNENTSYHSQNGKKISTEPFRVTIDLHDEVMCDTLFFTGYNRDIRHMPINFRIYGGISLDNMELLGSYENHPYEVRKMIAKFKMSKIRYYTLEILDTDTHQYVAISEMNVGLEFNGKEDTLDKATYYNFQYNKDNLATYGHLIKGNGYLTYNFEGSKFGLYTYQNEECTFIVEIDSIYKEEITLNATNEKKLAYLSEILNNGSHSVKITVLKGNLCVDSFIYA